MCRRLLRSQVIFPNGCHVLVPYDAVDIVGRLTDYMQSQTSNRVFQGLFLVWSRISLYHPESSLLRNNKVGIGRLVKIAPVSFI